MNKRISDANKGEIMLYKDEDGSTQIDVRMEDETVWLSQKQMAELFDKNVRTVNEHIGNIFEERELEPNSVIRKFRITASDGKRYETAFYNLDVIISVGYRVKSARGTQFRIWATSVLKDHLLKGYTLHRKRLEQKGFVELQNAIDLVRTTAERNRLTADEASGILQVVTSYMQTWLLLRRYDEGELSVPPKLRKPTFVMTVADACKSIDALKKELAVRKEASDLFGREREYGLEAVLGNIMQTFDGAELYPSLEEKAAHLLYFVIKDHPLVDGNKRCAVLLFLRYLDANDALPRGSNALRDNTLVSLALLIAESDPKQKDVMLNMILQFLACE